MTTRPTTTDFDRIASEVTSRFNTILPDYREHAPRLVGFGPVTFSTSRELAVRYRRVWDVNGYYRELGVPPDATRGQIKQAYQRRQGWRSSRLTYIVTQLLDPKVRAKYDASPLGMLFMDDYIEEAIKRRRMAEVVGLRRQGYLDEAELLADLDFDWGEGETNLSEMPSTVARSDYGDWPWAYYLWGSGCRDTARLKQWQELLIEAFWKEKRRYEIAVGFVGMNLPYETTIVGFRQVVFLGENEEPTEALARTAVSRVITNI